MTCPQCNKVLPDNANVCDNCGTVIQRAQPAQPAQPYMAAPAQYEDPKTKPLTVGNYLVMFLLQLIPIVGLVMLFVWAFGDENISRKNYARAQLIWLLIAIGIGVVVGIIVGIVFASVFAQLGLPSY